MCGRRGLYYLGDSVASGSLSLYCVIHSFVLMFLPPIEHKVDYGKGVGRKSDDNPNCNKDFVNRHSALLSVGAARTRTLLVGLIVMQVI